jgi:predicted outer membrane repeat protein
MICKALTTLLLAGIFLGSLNAETIYVDGSSRGRGHGTSKKPYNEIQFAIEKSNSGDTILVMPGTYREAIDFLGKAITVMSQDGASATIMDAAGLGQVSVVTFQNNEGANSVLKGFTIQNGQGSYHRLSNPIGGGIACAGTSPTISDVILKNNSAHLGGGICGIDGSNCLMTNVVFENNSAVGNGGAAMFNNNSRPSFLNCQFTQNSSGHTGGAINVRGSVPFISNCDFNNNHADDMAGAIRVGALSSATIDNSRFYNNTAPFGGALGAGSDTDGTPGVVTVTGSVFADNSATYGTQISINGRYPTIIDISYSYVQGGNTQSSVYVDPKWVRDEYLLWGDGMTS